MTELIIFTCMKKILPFLFLFCFFQLIGQEETKPRLDVTAALGHYSLSLLSPQLGTLHPGVKLGVDYRWTKGTKHQFTQSANLAYFYHRHFQKATQLYSEIAYKYGFKNGLSLTLVSIGGGYVLSSSDLDSFVWNEATQSYASTNKTNNNWLITLGSSVAYSLNKIIQKDISVFLDYRIQIQGVVIQETVPVIAYAPLHVGVSFPLYKSIKNEE